MNILYLIIISFLLEHQVCPEIQNFKGLFAYEIDAKLWSANDMIYRRPALVKFNNNKTLYNRGIFVFEYPTSAIEISNCNEQVLDKLKKTNVIFNDSIHSVLMNSNSDLVEINKLSYKLYEVNFEALLIGEKVSYFVSSSGKRVKKNIPVYLVTEFKEIANYQNSVR